MLAMYSPQMGVDPTGAMGMPMGAGPGALPPLPAPRPPELGPPAPGGPPMPGPGGPMPGGGMGLPAGPGGQQVTVQGLSPDQMIGQAPIEGLPQPGFMDQVGERLRNPLLQAGLGAGLGMLGASGQPGGLREALGAGLQGGLGGYMGAEQALKEEEKNKALEAVLAAQGGVMGRGALGGGAMPMPPMPAPNMNPGSGY